MTVIINGTSGITDVNGTAAAPAITGTDTDTGVFFGTNTVSLSTGGTERLQVDSSGNLGLGVTPSAWNAGGKTIELGVAGNIQYGGTGFFGFSQNAYYNSGWKFANASSSRASYYEQTGGAHAWTVSTAAGTAGNAITFTTAMTLDSSGNLLVNSTGISGNGKLHVKAADGTSGNEYRGLTVASTTTEAKSVNIAYDSANDVGVIAASHYATGWKNLALCPSGGNLLVGTTTTKQQLTVANLGHFAGRTQVGAAFIGDDATGGNNKGIVFASGGLFPANGSGTTSDNSYDLGASSYRWKVVYAGTGTINTSDANEKQDVYFLDDAEKRVAIAIKSLIKKYRFKDAVLEKGDSARIHVGVMAQDVAAAFVSEGLDPSRYALFCSDTWYEVDGKAMDENVKAYTSESDGAVSVTRLGIRYDELLAFVIAAI